MNQRASAAVNHETVNTKSSGEHRLCYESTAMKILGLSRKSFRKLGLEPAKVVPNPYWRSGLNSYLYVREEIQNIKESRAVLELKPKPRKPFGYNAKFSRKYGSQENAILDVASAMFNLNRYCKHGSCSEKNRNEIYALKNQLIKKLYLSGHCQQVHVHTYGLDEQLCFRCNGTGEAPPWYHEAEEDDLSIRDCPKCHGTGIHKFAKTLKFYAFLFGIENLRFVWHQPEEAIDFAINIDEAIPQSTLNDTQVKPLGIPRRKLTEAKALVRWFINRNVEPPDLPGLTTVA